MLYRVRSQIIAWLRQNNTNEIKVVLLTSFEHRFLSYLTTGGCFMSSLNDGDFSEYHR